MTNPLFKFSPPFTDKKKTRHVPVILVRAKSFSAWLKKQSANVKALCAETGFSGQAEKTLVVRDSRGQIERIVVGVRTPVSVYDISHAVTALRNLLTKDSTTSVSFFLAGEPLKGKELENAHTGWGFACYLFDMFKSTPAKFPVLQWSKGVDKARVLANVESVHFLRNIINAPSNIMGPAELEQAARHVAGKSKANVKLITDKDLLRKNFPLIYAVGQGSDRRPRLIDITWGNTRHPKVTLVGKGVCFDTGGLNIKPGPAMALMKKDMGGAAHVLALGNLIMRLKLPVRLRILIPAVENSIGGSAFRPGDVFKSRKGVTVENTNTDAEGRLILADALTYACEEKPDLLIDYATLTGSARVGLGLDIPPVFSNNDFLAGRLKNLSESVGDQVWPMPLWRDYKRHIESSIADLINSASIPGDLIFSAVFLEQFLTGKPDWLHLDIYAWEHTGRAGRPKGGADTGLRAVLALIEDRYAKKRKK